MWKSGDRTWIPFETARPLAALTTYFNALGIDGMADLLEGPGTPPSDPQVFLGAIGMWSAHCQAIKWKAHRHTPPQLPALTSSSSSPPMPQPSFLSFDMAPPNQLPNIPNAFVDPTAASVTMTNADGSNSFTPPSMVHAFADYDVNLRNGQISSVVPMGYHQFSARWNEDQNCQFRFSTYDPVTGTVTTSGVPLPAVLLDAINPPAPCPTTPAPSHDYSEAQRDLIQQMLWGAARRESYFEKKREAAFAKRTEDRRSKREAYRVRNAAMGRPRTPHKAPAVAPTATTAVVNPITIGAGTSTVAATPLANLNPTAPSAPIAGPSNDTIPTGGLTLPLVASSSSGSASGMVPPPRPPRAPSPMQEDGPELGAATPAAAATPGAEPIFTEDDLINFSDVDDEVPLAAMKGKGKGRA